MPNETDDVVSLPRQPQDMLDFLMKGVSEAMKQELPPEAIIRTFHDYACYWLSATAGQDLSEPLPITNETDKRLN